MRIPLTSSELKKLRRREWMRLDREKNPEKYKARSRAYYLANKEKIKDSTREWKLKNSEKVREFNRKHDRKNALRNRKRKRAYEKSRGDAHKEMKRAYHLKRLQEPQYRLREILRRVLPNALRNYRGKKHSSALDLLGCSLENLKSHIEHQFRDGMTWENYGRRSWHIDHIRPISSFDLTRLEEQKVCFHYTNLQPLWANENLSKGNRIFAPLV